MGPGLDLEALLLLQPPQLTLKSDNPTMYPTSARKFYVVLSVLST